LDGRRLGGQALRGLIRGRLILQALMLGSLIPGGPWGARLISGRFRLIGSA